MVVEGVYRYGASFVPKFLGGEVIKNGWVQVDPPALCTNGSEKLLRHKSVKSYDSAITAIQNS